MKQNVKNYGINFGAIALSYIVFVILLQTGIISSYYEGIIVMIFINIILATSLNLVTGFLGELALGHAGFMAIGAYTAALATMNMNLPNAVQLPISLLLGGLAAGVAGIIIGIPALRLRGDYLAIITLGFGEIIRICLTNLKSITNGAKGLNGIPRLLNFDFAFWGMVVIVTILYLLTRSRHGRAIMSIRENEIAADAVGIPTTYYKIFAFAIAAFFAGIGGGFYAHYRNIINPEYFNFMYSIEILVIVVLGGMGSFTASILAAIVLTILPEALRSVSEWRMLIYSILLIVMMIFRPEGLLGTWEFSLIKTIAYIKNKLFKKKTA